MIHFRQERLLNKHFMELSKEGVMSDTYKFQGREIEITMENFGSLDSKLKQSYSTFLSKKYQKSPPIVKSKPLEGTEANGSIEDENFDNKSLVLDKNDKFSTKEQLIYDFLYRVSYHEKILEEKLHYPRVFQRLLSQPHLAFEERKKTIESYHDLHLFVDHYTSYNPKDNGFMNSLIRIGKTIKGITVYNYPALRPPEGGYYSDVVKKLPLDSKILIFSQGCGGIENHAHYPHKAHYITHFCKGENCGCDTIPYHEKWINEKKINVTMHYEIYNEDHLHKLSGIK